MSVKPEIGMAVQLNSNGMQAIGGLTSERMVQASRHMIITDVEEIPCDDFALYALYFEGNILGQFLLTNADVDLYHEES